MASVLEMVAPPATAPIDIQSTHSSCSAAAVINLSAASSSITPALLGGSPADSGYESSWPSLSEAAAWSPPGQKRQLTLKSSTGNSNSNSNISINNDGSISPDCNPFNASGNPSLVHHGIIKHSKGHRQQQQQTQAQRLGQSQSEDQGQVQQESRLGKAQRRRVRTQAYHAKRMAQLQNMMPLVDFGSPQMEDDDHRYGPVDPPIPLSVIPRGWLYEEDFGPSLADDVLVALPKRQWVYDSSSPMSMDTKSFVVMSWNVLSPKLCHASRLDARCEPAFLDWNYRKEAILNQVAFTDADIVCLQELELKDYEEYFNPRLTRLGFKSIHAYKMNIYEMRDGCAIFYRDSRFKLLSDHVLRFNQVELDDCNVKRPSMARDTAIRFNLFHNLAVVAFFENRRTKRQIQVATTHLLADPAFPDAKMLQTAILTSKLEELKAEAVASIPTSTSTPIAETAATATATATAMTEGSTAGMTPHPPNQSRAKQHIPTILAGDLNSLPDSSVVNFLKTGQIDTCHFGGNDFGRFTRAGSKYFHHHLGLVDSYNSSILPFTNVTRKFQGTIDYLLYDPSSLGLVGFLDHFEPDLTWHTAAMGPGTIPDTSGANHHDVNMSSSDLDSEMEMDLPSLSSSFASSLSISPILSSARGKKVAKKTVKMIPHLDFSKLFTKPTTSTTTTNVSASNSPSKKQEVTEPMVVRAAMPTALPSQHFPSDHIPLVAIFREREYMPISQVANTGG
ncbi:Endonuclease/exonuclease/phosphatase [Gamsiella multidivaricata]|uniref:Endonuclease/exonuclease/phosphatase n=1 Tax=Gamsiella multidivaricata TaxID=101098 RepID=UPI00221F4C46|nr:Endonuclease/exonuclease/phosphatase [Gamsiella multidivaricata]KAI7831182.1 Endonuclease/exonuclease/phosphatase [Gamsiella multidivaricata]